MVRGTKNYKIENKKIAVVSPFLSVIILNVNRFYSPMKIHRLLNEFLKIQLYAVYKKIILDLRAHILWKWKDRIKYSMIMKRRSGHIHIKQNRFKSITTTETKKDIYNNKNQLNRNVY